MRASVIVVLVLFLFSWRAGVISFTAIPLSLLVAIIVLVVALTLGAGSFAGGIFAGAFALKDSSPVVIWAVWSGLSAAFLFV